MRAKSYWKRATRSLGDAYNTSKRALNYIDPLVREGEIAFNVAAPALLALNPEATLAIKAALRTYFNLRDIIAGDAVKTDLT